MITEPIVPAGELIPAPLPAQPNPPHRILVVEDDADIRHLNTEIVIGAGYHVDAAEDGAIAWDALQRNRYDLLVTDNLMPKVSGVELLKKLQVARVALPVITATGNPPTETFARHPGLRPAATLLKPYTFDELVGAVKAVLHAAAGVRAMIVPLNCQKP